MKNKNNQLCKCNPFVHWIDNPRRRWSTGPLSFTKISSDTQTVWSHRPSFSRERRAKVWAHYIVSTYTRKRHHKQRLNRVKKAAIVSLSTPIIIAARVRGALPGNSRIRGERGLNASAERLMLDRESFMNNEINQLLRLLSTAFNEIG